MHNAIVSAMEESDKESSSLRSCQFWDKVVVGGGSCMSASSDSFTSVAKRKGHPEATALNACAFHPDASVVGDILHFRNAGLVDPLLALETVVTGKWIMIDCSAEDSSNNDPFPDRLECLLDFFQRHEARVAGLQVGHDHLRPRFVFLPRGPWYELPIAGRREE